MVSTHGWSIRPGNPHDGPVLQRMIYEALYWQPDAVREPFDFVVAHPEIARYVHDWGRIGDGAIIAKLDATGEAIGAAWYRLLPEDMPGYGYVSSEIPELAIAVVPGYRGRGVGRALMEALIEQARRSGAPALSLSVELANTRALGLYERLGFRAVGGDEHNHTMILELNGSV